MVNIGQEKIYIQSALNVDTEEKQNQETFSLKNSGDFFRKIVIVDGTAKQWTDENGIVYIVSFHFCWKKRILVSKRTYIFTNPTDRWPQTLGTRVYLLAESVMNRR